MNQTLNWPQLHYENLPSLLWIATKPYPRVGLFWVKVIVFLFISAFFPEYSLKKLDVLQSKDAYVTKPQTFLKTMQKTRNWYFDLEQFAQTPSTELFKINLTLGFAYKINSIYFIDLSFRGPNICPMQKVPCILDKDIFNSMVDLTKMGCKFLMNGTQTYQLRTIILTIIST